MPLRQVLTCSSFTSTKMTVCDGTEKHEQTSLLKANDHQTNLDFKLPSQRELNEQHGREKKLLLNENRNLKRQLDEVMLQLKQPAPKLREVMRESENVSNHNEIEEGRGQEAAQKRFLRQEIMIRQYGFGWGHWKYTTMGVMAKLQLNCFKIILRLVWCLMRAILLL
mmetsp:Transcript_26816/g.34591  ORF Transcript_26816/g.34591 Transcript_26816/m.34591 type:complete len:167 (+) Transcript_26816:286-786(+)